MMVADARIVAASTVVICATLAGIAETAAITLISVMTAARKEEGAMIALSAHLISA